MILLSIVLGVVAVIGISVAGYFIFSSLRDISKAEKSEKEWKKKVEYYEGLTKKEFSEQEKKGLYVYDNSLSDSLKGSEKDLKRTKRIKNKEKSDDLSM